MIITIFHLYQQKVFYIYYTISFQFQNNLYLCRTVFFYPTNDNYTTIKR